MAGYLNLISIFTLVLSYILSCESFAYPDQGKWDFRLDGQNDQVAVVKSLFKESEIRIQITCDSKDDQSKLTVSWSLGEVACWRDYLHINEALSRSVPPNDLQRALDNASFYTVKSPPEEHDCDHNIQLKELTIAEDAYTDIQSEAAGVHGMPVDPKDQGSRLRRQIEQESSQVKSSQQENKLDHQSQSPELHEQRQVLKQIHTKPSSRPVMKVTKDGFYMLSLQLTSNSPFSADVHIEMKGKQGYLSAADWPLLPFYGAMCLVYVVLGLAWLIVSFLQWRDLLRIQFWIGGVILLGMLEKAMFYAEYQSINTTGQSAQTAVLLAEFVSCGKRTLARMLVIIVSLGFGIVKPRLGPMLHRTVATGILYFLLAASEAYLRVMRPKSDPANQMLMASVPLAVLDSAICWWIFTSLVQTTRTLRLRRNMVKLNLYRHFTNTLIFAVISSVVFMLYSIKAHYLVNCFTAWKELWIDDAYWKLLFSVILLVIMILWRPTNNNQRYAFTPLLDAPEDGDDEEEEYFVSDAYGVKMRGGLNSGTSSPKQKLSMNSAEEDLKWVEENIPTSLADSALPILDSDEEIMNTKFELSKMQ
ncbi:transmembrane protein 87A-like [Macrosteles quadrilineatus]|uniref:transmembrane protein 87A-like n=1 Tax=Macrosteles quadrilineatus TaxID=74068 RepID=UPI0023E1FF01|nr:transmembrane protein 87A-like [Macrosteles quadrilineatus]